MAAPQAGDVNPYAAPKAAVSDAIEQTQPVRFFSISGRIGRVRYVNSLIALNILLLVAGVALAIIAGPLMLFAGVPYVILVLMLTIQRCHDFDVTGWLALLSLIPYAFLIFCIIPGTKGRNRFGPPTPPNSTLALVLVWILSAIAVVGIVAAIAIPQYQSYVKRAQQVEMRR